MSPTPVEFQGDYYSFIITDRRLLWHKETGLIFKRDNFVSVPIELVSNIKYLETGLLRKKANIRVEVGNKPYEFSGPQATIIAIYNELQSYQKSV
ncbi:MAG: hypothetical protein QXQ39_06590 [Conexivisphaerales archaeon]